MKLVKETYLLKIEEGLKRREKKPDSTPVVLGYWWPQEQFQ